MSFAIIQASRDERPTLGDGRLGVIHPVNMDGFYRDKEDARQVADYMARERPDLETFLVEAIDAFNVER